MLEEHNHPPGDIDCSNVDWSGVSPGERKTSVQALISRIIATIERGHRAPDEWESGHLSAAIRSVELCAYRLAHVSACRALLPDDQRGPLPETLAERHATTADLRRRLDVARAFMAIRMAC